MSETLRQPDHESWNLLVFLEMMLPPVHRRGQYGPWPGDGAKLDSLQSGPRWRTLKPTGQFSLK